MGGRRFDWHHL